MDKPLKNWKFKNIKGLMKNWSDFIIGLKKRKNFTKFSKFPKHSISIPILSKIESIACKSEFAKYFSFDLKLSNLISQNNKKIQIDRRNREFLFFVTFIFRIIYKLLFI